MSKHVTFDPDNIASRITQFSEAPPPKRDLTLAEVLEKFRPAIKKKLDHGWTVDDVVTQLNALEIPVSPKMIRGLVNLAGRGRAKKAPARVTKAA